MAEAGSPGGGYDPLGSVGGAAAPEPRLRMASPVTGEEERRAIEGVLGSGVLTNGPFTRRFEEMMAARHGTDHGVALSNGTVALAAMLIACGIGPGDEVIVPSLTFIASATSVVHVGATPVFAEVLPDTLDLDPADVEARITDRTAAIMPVHYAGQPADMPRLLAVAERHGLPVLEDAAQAHGASLDGRPAGSWGVAGMFSFTPTKNITTGEGAVVTTGDAALAHKLRLLRNHGMSAPYRHEIIGWNWRLTEMQAAMGCCQLDRLDAILAAKAQIADHLRSLLAEVPGVEPLAVRPGVVHPNMLFTVVMEPDARSRAEAALAARGIETRIYFPPAHRQPAFGHPAGTLPVSEALADRILSIPSHTRITEPDRIEIVETLAAAAET